MMRHRAPQRLRDISAIFDDRAADVENHEPDRRWRFAGRCQSTQGDCSGEREPLQ